MYLGRFQLGDTLTLRLQTRNGSRTPVVPDNVPKVKVFTSNGSKLVSYLMPVVDRYKATGLFALPVFLSGLWAPGLYTAVYYYSASGYQGLEYDTFEVMPGGDGAGNVISMYFFDRPQARYIVYQCDGGLLLQGRNPTV